MNIGTAVGIIIVFTIGIIDGILIGLNEITEKVSLIAAYKMLFFNWGYGYHWNLQ